MGLLGSRAYYCGIGAGIKLRQEFPAAATTVATQPIAYRRFYSLSYSNTHASLAPKECQ